MFRQDLWYYILIKIAILTIFNIGVLMSKMKKRRKRRKLSKLLKSLPKIKKRIPVPPPSKIFKSKKDYDRSENKKIIKKELDG